MAGALTCRPEGKHERERALDIVEGVYGTRPTPFCLPWDTLVVEEDGRVVAFAALYRLDDVVIGAADWVAVEQGRSEDDRAEILGQLLDGFRELKARYALRAIMVHTPYDEIRRHLDGAADLQPGETGIRRLEVQTGA